MYNRKGLTLIEIILAIALIGILAVSFITVFPSQIKNISIGSNITQDAFDNQGIFEELIFDVKSLLKSGSLSTNAPQLTIKTVNVDGKTIDMQKLNYKNPTMNDKETTIYLSEKLAKVESSTSMVVENVFIDVNNGGINYPKGQVADLDKAPFLTAVYDDNSSQSSFYANIFRWWRTQPGVDPSTLKFPDDYVLIDVSQSLEVLDNLLDKVGANSYVLLSITPVDVHGYRGTTKTSENIVFVKGAEWRIGTIPWVDTNNNYKFEAVDHKLVLDSIVNKLDGTKPFPNPAEPSTDLDLSDGSLFVPMGVGTLDTTEPGNKAIEVDGPQKIEWLIERNINLAKDFKVKNSSDIILKAGLGPNGGAIFLHPYVKLDADGKPIINGAVPELLDTGVSLNTDGNIFMETVGRGSIQLYENAELFANKIQMKSRGNINITKASLNGAEITLKNSDDPYITGNRKISLVETHLSGSQVNFDSPEEVLFKGGSWSKNQTINIADGKKIRFEKGIKRVNNLGVLNLGNTGEVSFTNEDLSNQLRLRIVKVEGSDNKIQIIPHNYIRNLKYASPRDNIVFDKENTWKDIGSNKNNIEFSMTILDGSKNYDDVKFSFNGNDIIEIKPNSTIKTDLTRVRIDFRDKYSNRQIKGVATFKYFIDNGNITIIIDDEIPVITYIIKFESNGGTPVPNIELEYGQDIIPPQNPVKDGYTFDGWDPLLPPSMGNTGFTVYADWIPNVYNINFYRNYDVNDNQKTTESIKYSYKYSSIPMIDPPTRADFTFAGWFTNREGTGEKILSTDIYLITGEQNLYAKWTPKKYSVLYRTPSGNLHKTQTYEKGQTIIPPALEKDWESWSGLPTNLLMPGNDIVVTAVAKQVNDLRILGINNEGWKKFTIKFNNDMNDSTNPTNRFVRNVNGKEINYSRGSWFWGAIDPDENVKYRITVNDKKGNELEFNVYYVSEWVQIIGPIGYYEYEWKWEDI